MYEQGWIGLGGDRRRAGSTRAAGQEGVVGSEWYADPGHVRDRDNDNFLSRLRPFIRVGMDRYHTRFHAMDSVITHDTIRCPCVKCSTRSNLNTARRAQPARAEGRVSGGGWQCARRPLRQRAGGRGGAVTGGGLAPLVRLSRQTRTPGRHRVPACSAAAQYRRWRLRRAGPVRAELAGWWAGPRVVRAGCQVVGEGACVGAPAMGAGAAHAGRAPLKRTAACAAAALPRHSVRARDAGPRLLLPLEWSRLIARHAGRASALCRG